MKTTKSKIRCGGMSTILVLRSELLRRVALVLALGLIVWLVGSSEAEPMGTAWTYQGRLMDANDAADGEYDFRFELFDDPCTGTQQGSTIDVNDLDVIDGYFTVALDFGSDVFDGNAVWLETTVAQADGSDPCTLLPRIEITPVPYALQIRGLFVDDACNVGIGTTGPTTLLHINGSPVGARGQLSISSPPGEDTFLSFYEGSNFKAYLWYDDSDDDLRLQNYNELNGGDLSLNPYGGNVGIGTTSPSAKLEVVGDVNVSGSVITADNSISGITGGFEAAHANDVLSFGVKGSAVNTTTDPDPDGPDNFTYGGYFTAEASPGGCPIEAGRCANAYGVYGEASGGDYIYGGYFKALDPGDYGGAYGVYGEATGSDYGQGVTGKAPSRGVVGYATGSDGYGVYGYAYATGNVTNYGGYFRARGEQGRGVYGYASASSGVNYGVYGKTNSSTGYAGYFVGARSYFAGNVGIGTTSPAYKLDVSGDIRSTGSIYGTVDNADKLDGQHGSYYRDWNNLTNVPPGFADGVDDVGTGGDSDWIISGNDMYSIPTGKVGIGTKSPEAKLTVVSPEADGKAVYGWASNQFGYTTYGGYFKADSRSGIGVYARGGYQGLAAKFDGNVIIRNQSGTKYVVELGEGLDYAEGFDVSDKSEIAGGTVLVIDSKNPGKLAISDKPYDSRVAGIVAGAKGQGSGVRLGSDEFDYDVALAGRVYCNVDATEAGVEPGDLLTTSATLGYAMKAGDYIRAQGAVLGKAMESLEKGKKGQILVLVTLQ